MEIEQRLKRCEDEIAKINRRIDSILEKKEEIPKVTIPKKMESPREFYHKFKTKKDTEKTLLIIHYLEKYKQTGNITIKEIAEGFKEVREQVPANISDKIQLLDKRGFLLKTGKVYNRQCWVLTNSAEKFLEGLRNG